MIIRRCCWNNCGEDGLSIYEGRLTYFCSNDACNGNISDQYLTQGGKQPIEGSGDEQTTIQLPSISSTTTIQLPSISSSTGNYFYTIYQ
jgi:hypothetical protein